MKQLLYISSLFILINISVEINIFGINIQTNDSLHNINNTTNFNEEDAYYIYNNVELELINAKYSLKRINVSNSYATAYSVELRYSSRLKINTRKGLENFAYLTLKKEEKTIMKSFEVITIKSNGSIIKFDSSQIFHSSIPQTDDTKDNLNIIKYIIPGVEVGDEIEFNYSCEYSGSITDRMFGNVFMQNFLPSIQSNYKVIIPSPYKVIYKCYNGFKKPTILTDVNKITSTFSLDSVIPIKDYYYTCLADELPYFYYAIENEKSINQFPTWSGLYYDFTNSTTFYYDLDNPDLDYIGKWIKKKLKGHRKR